MHETEAEDDGFELVSMVEPPTLPSRRRKPAVTKPRKRRKTMVQRFQAWAEIPPSPEAPKEQLSDSPKAPSEEVDGRVKLSPDPPQSPVEIEQVPIQSDGFSDVRMEQVHAKLAYMDEHSHHTDTDTGSKEWIKFLAKNVNRLCKTNNLQSVNECLMLSIDMVYRLKEAGIDATTEEFLVHILFVAVKYEEVAVIDFADIACTTDYWIPFSATTEGKIMQGLNWVIGSAKRWHIIFPMIRASEGCVQPGAADVASVLAEYFAQIMLGKPSGTTPHLPYCAAVITKALWRDNERKCKQACDVWGVAWDEVVAIQLEDTARLMKDKQDTESKL